MAPPPACATRLRSWALLLSVVLSGSAAGQAANTIGVDSSVALPVTVLRESAPVEDVAVRSGSIRRSTDAEGVAVLQLAPGDRQIVAAKIGFKPETVFVALRAGVDTSVTIALLEQATELSAVIVSATRNGRVANVGVRLEAK